MKTFSFVLILILVLVFILSACATNTATSKTASNSANQTTSTPSTLTPQTGGVLKVVPRLPSKVFGYPGDMTMSAACDISCICLESLERAGVGARMVLTQQARICMGEHDSVISPGDGPGRASLGAGHFRALHT